MYLFGLDWLVLSLAILASAVVALAVSGFAKEILCFLLENAIEKAKGERNVVLLTIKKNMVEKLKQLVLSVTSVQKASIMTLVYSSIAAVLFLCIKYSDYIAAHLMEALVIATVFCLACQFALKSLRAHKKTKTKKTTDSLAKEIVAELEANAHFNSEPQVRKSAETAVAQTTNQRRTQVIPANTFSENSSVTGVNVNNPLYTHCGMTQEAFERFVNETYH